MILLNGQEKEFKGSWKSVPGLVRSFYESGRFPDELITELKVNGIDVPLDSPLDICSEQEHSIEFSTITGQKALAECNRESNSQADRLLEMLEKSVERFRSGTEAEAHAGFVECVTALMHLVNFLQDIEGIKSIVLKNHEDFPTVGLNIRAFQELMGEIIRAQEESDWVMLADLMEYELSPMIREWKPGLGIMTESEKANQ